MRTPWLRWNTQVDAAIRLAFLCGMGIVFGGQGLVCLAQQTSSRTIEPPDVLVRVAAVRAELEELRILMGAPENDQPEMDVRGAAPREVYFQALTLFQKADRMCFEHTREHAAPPELREGELTPADVHGVVDKALQCVRQVKKKYGLETESSAAERDDAALPTDVFKSIVQANRQLNLMLERRIAPSDVFQQVTLAVGYASRLLEAFPGATTLPDEPPYEAGLRPEHVYRRLLECVDRLRGISELSGLTMLELKIDEARLQSTEPSDVYDVASLIVAEAAYLHSKLPAARQPRQAYHVGRKFPSHVYQRAGILDRQFVELERRVKANPDWLTRERTD